MILFKKADTIYKYLDSQRKIRNTIGFVPTMGALHDGHLSLIRMSLQQNPTTVCSLFVNPTQFNDPADFKKYPVTIEKDIQLLEEAGCNLLFLPPVEEIYPDGKPSSGNYELGRLETLLEGKYRPGHFQGVCMVVHRLLDIIKPDLLYLGQKDYQQCMVIQKLLTLINTDEQTKVVTAPTLREKDGLAMSSRNMRLSPDEREKAAAIYQALSYIKANLVPGSTVSVIKTVKENLIRQGFKPDYVSIADAGDLSLQDVWDGEKKVIALIAAYLNEVRLIDNMLIN